jgi:hypothetical protein
MDSSILIAGTFPLVFTAVSVVIDALMLFQLKWAPLGGAFRDSAVANLVSLVVMALLIQLILAPGNVFLSVLVALAISWAVEGFVLMLLRRRRASASYLAALAANFTAFIFAYTYVLTFLLI